MVGLTCIRVWMRAINSELEFVRIFLFCFVLIIGVIVIIVIIVQVNALLDTLDQVCSAAGLLQPVSC